MATHEADDFFDRFEAEANEVSERGYAIALGRPLIANNSKGIVAYSVNWTLRCMYHYNCPPILAPVIAKIVAEKEKRADLSAYKEDGDSILMKNGPFFEHMMESISETVADVHVGKVDIPPEARGVPRFPWRTSAHGIRNKRRKMEDQHVVLPCAKLLQMTQMAMPQTALFLVCDGHGGAEAADYVAAHLPIDLICHELYASDLLAAMKAVVEETDKNFLDFTSSLRVRCGTTLLLAAIRDNVLHMVWVGDSVGMLSRNAKPAVVTKPHRPSDEEEQQRIHDLGGIVVEIQGSWRVSGQVAVSRAIGDASQKRYITSKPDSVSVVLDGTEDFLVLGCDGLWDSDKSSPETICQELNEFCKADTADFSRSAHHLVELAAEGTSDNITVVVVDLRGYLSSCEAR